MNVMNSMLTEPMEAGADPGFLEREFICLKVWGFALLLLYDLIFLRPNYFIFIGYL